MSMKPTCKKIKFKKRRNSKPIVRKKIEPVIADRRSKSSEDEEYDLFGEYYAGEEVPYPREHPTELQKGTIELLREWVRKQRFIPQDLSNEFLGLFLSAVGFNVDLAAERMNVYFLSRQEPSPLFRDRDLLSPENMKIFKKLYVLPMPDTTEDGRKIILTGLINKTANYCQLEHSKALAFVLDLLIWVNLLQEKDFGFGDFVIVLDGRNFLCPQLLQNQVFDHRYITSLLLDTIPGTLRSFYFLYPPCYLTKVADNRNGIWMTVIKSKKEMTTHLPADILPLEYGGNLGHLDDLLEQWNLHMTQNRDFFLHFERRMIRDYERRICYERERREGGRNWVSRMKLEADEWEYKTKYYEKMKNLKPLKHPAYGPDRLLNMPKTKPKTYNRLPTCRKLAQQELEDDYLLNPIKYHKMFTEEPEMPRTQTEPEPEIGYCLRLNIYNSQFVIN